MKNTLFIIEHRYVPLGTSDGTKMGELHGAWSIHLVYGGRDSSTVSRTRHGGGDMSTEGALQTFVSIGGCIKLPGKATTSCPCINPH